MAILLDSTVVEHRLNLLYVPSMAFKDPSLFENKIDHNTVYWGGEKSLNIDVMVRYLPNILKHCKFWGEKKNQPDDKFNFGSWLLRKNLDVKFNIPQGRYVF